MLSEYGNKLIVNLENALQVQMATQFKANQIKDETIGFVASAKAQMIVDDPKLAQWKTEQKVLAALQADPDYADLVTRQAGAEIDLAQAKVAVEIARETLRVYRAEQYAQGGQ